jgi:NAD(P)-dependent dehydrogenase (short-subunit alcohol dehydrogenase family)
VTNEQSVNAAFEAADADSRYPIRGLVTCAGISGRSSAIDYSVDEFRRIVDVNLTGTFLCARAAARIFHRQMVKGSIVMLASMSARVVNQV